MTPNVFCHQRTIRHCLNRLRRVTKLSSTSYCMTYLKIRLCRKFFFIALHVVDYVFLLQCVFSPLSVRTSLISHVEVASSCDPCSYDSIRIQLQNKLQIYRRYTTVQPLI